MSSVKITDNTGNIARDTTVKANIFLRFVADEIVKESTPNTPKKSGRLRMDILKQVLGLTGQITWGKNYAIYQESTQYKNYTTPGTGPHFAENAVRKVYEKAEEIAKRAGLIKR